MDSCELCLGREIKTIGMLEWPKCPECNVEMHGPFGPTLKMECHFRLCANSAYVVHVALSGEDYGELSMLAERWGLPIEEAAMRILQEEVRDV